MDKEFFFTQNLLEELRGYFPNIEGWFYSLNIEYDESLSLITVGFPHIFFSRWFSEECEEYFTKSIYKVCEQNSKNIPTINYLKPLKEKKNTENIPSNIFLANKLQDFFETFIHNNKNEFPFKVACEIAKNPFESKYNPLIFYGKTCTGKTTFLQCIKSYITQHHFHENLIFYGDIETLIKLFSNDVQSVVNKFSIFIIDNIQDEFIKEYQSFFYEFIKLCNFRKKQVIGAYTHNYKNNLAWIDNLRHSVNSTLLMHLKESDIDVRMRYATVQCHKLSLHLKKENILLLAQKCMTVCILHSVLLKISVFSKLSNTLVKREDIENILNSENDEIKNLTPNAIITFIADYFEMTEENILSTKKNPDIVHARYVTMYLCRELLGLSYPSIGKIFGGKHHSTVIHAIKKIKKKTDTNKNMQIMMSDLRIKCLAL